MDNTHEQNLIDSAPEYFKPYIETGTVLGAYLKHPLMFTPLAFVGVTMPNGGQVTWATLMQEIHRLEDAVEEAMAAGNYERAIFMHERPYRVDALRACDAARTDDPDIYGYLCALVWADSENIHENLPFWDWTFKHVNGYHWMNDAERDALESFPDTLTVYRGMCTDGGYSWSLDRSVAEFFANRGTHFATGEVRTATVPKESVYAYLDSRNEREIIITDPEFRAGG